MFRDLLTALPYLVALTACAVALVIAIHYAELRGPGEDAPSPEFTPEWPAPDGKPAGHGKPKTRRAFRDMPLSERIALRLQAAHEQEESEHHHHQEGNHHG